MNKREQRQCTWRRMIL